MNNIKYDIFESKTISDLIIIVTENLRNGWELQGGVCVMTFESANDFFYYQAMVKKEEVNETTFIELIGNRFCAKCDTDLFVQDKIIFKDIEKGEIVNYCGECCGKLGKEGK